MALNYSPPGVTVAEIVSTSIVPVLAADNVLCLVGYSQGNIIQSDIVVLSGTTQIPLPSLPNNAASATITQVQDIINPGAAVSNGNPTGFWVSSTDYTFNTNTSPATTALTQVLDSLITSTVVNVTSTTGFPGAGTIIVDNEYITYTGKTSTTFTGCTRGTNNTAPAPHNVAAAATQPRFTIGLTSSPSAYVSAPATVKITYSYIPQNYFLPRILTSQADVISLYGAPYSSDGITVNSPLSLAGQIAFENGASQIVCQPLFYLASGVPTQPNQLTSGTTGSWASSNTWGVTLASLQAQAELDVVVPVIGQSMTNVGDADVLTIFEAVQDLQFFMNSNQNYFISVFGEDSSANVNAGTEATLTAHVAQLQSRYGGVLSQQTVMLSPSRFTRTRASASGTFLIGGQYMAAAIGGMLVSRSAASPLTRQNVAGFIDAPDPRTRASRNADAQAGLLVLEPKNGLVQVRHAITIDNSSTARRELSVIRAKFLMMTSIRQILEDNVIGRLIADDDSLAIIAGVVTGELELLKGTGQIVDYNSVSARILSLEPTTVEVRFSYLPAFPINYINVNFSINLADRSATINNI